MSVCVCTVPTISIIRYRKPERDSNTSTSSENGNMARNKSILCSLHPAGKHLKSSTASIPALTGHIQLPIVCGFDIQSHTKSCLPALRETAYHLKTYLLRTTANNIRSHCTTVTFSVIQSQLTRFLYVFSSFLTYSFRTWFSVAMADVIDHVSGFTIAIFLWNRPSNVYKLYIVIPDPFLKSKTLSYVIWINFPTPVLKTKTIQYHLVVVIIIIIIIIFFFFFFFFFFSCVYARGLLTDLQSFFSRFIKECAALWIV